MKTSKKEISLLLIILSIFLFQSIITLKETNLTFDEPLGITYGYYMLKHADISIFPLHTPLSYITGAYPLLFQDIKLPYSYEKCDDIGWYQCPQDMVFEAGNDPERMGFYVKIPFLLLSLLLGLLLYFFAKELYGTKAAFVSLTLYAFSPAILAYNTVIFTDMFATFFIFASIYALWKLLIQGYTKKRLILTGILAGLAISSKQTAIFLFPLIAIICLTKIFVDKKERKKNIKIFSIQFILIILISSITLHATYFFSFDSLDNSMRQKYVKRMDGFIDKNFEKYGKAHEIAYFLAHDLKIPMPEFISGLGGQFLAGSSKLKTSYLNGEIYKGGKWYYFPEVLLIKTPIPLIIFFLIALFFTMKKHKRMLINEVIILLPILCFLGIFVINSLNLGLRHILPIMPFIFLYSSKITKLKLKNSLHNKLFRLFIGILLLWYIISALIIMPNYMAYFNEFIGGPENGHKYLLSSNLDQGQDLKRLSKYLEKNNIDKIKLSYHGMFDPSYYNISYEALPMEHYIPWNPNFIPGEPDENYKEDCSKQKGIIAISISNLHNVQLTNKSCFDWLNEYKPIERIGYTIYIYNITS